MTAVLPEPTATTPTRGGTAPAGRHRAPADATTGSMGPVPATRRSRSAHGAQRPAVAPIQRAARTAGLSLAALGAVATAGGMASHGLGALGHGDQPATTGEMALPTTFTAADMAVHPAQHAVAAPAVMPVASSAPVAHPQIKTVSAASKAAQARSSAAPAKKAADQKAATGQQAAASSVGSKVLSMAKGQIGVPYEWGGTTPSGFDCSGLMQWAYGKAGKDLPRTAAAQSKEGTPVSTSNLQPGDLVFMYSPVSHVAMYAGNGMLLEAPTEGEDVKMTPMSHYKSKIVGARRV